MKGRVAAGWMLTACAWLAATPAHSQCDFDPQTDCPGDLTFAAPQGQCFAAVTFEGPCNCDLTPGSFPAGFYPVTCTDDGGDVCQFDVTVTEPDPPQITCDPDTAQDNLPGQCGAIAAYNVIPAAACDEAPSIQCNVQSGDFVPVGTTAITCTATDQSGNSATCTRNETVNDAEAPSFPPLPDVTAQSPDGNPVAVSYGPVPVDDNCGATPVCAPASGSLFALGPTTVTCNASDSAGNAALPASFLVTVIAALLAVPTLSQWGLAGLACLLAAASVALLRR